MNDKPKLAVFKFSSCAGCQLQIVNLEEYLLDIAALVEISYFVMAKRENADAIYDIGLVEGAVTCGEEIEKIKEVREKCKLLIAFGSCACYGGIPSMKNLVPEREVEKRVYEDVSVIHSTKAFGIDQYVRVDGYLKGCPVDKDELVELIKSALLGVGPNLRPHCVCVECKLRENVCLFVSKGKVCMGSVTSAGCGALCPSLNRPCEGCRGPMNDPNAPSLAKTFMEYGLTSEDVARKFRKYAGETEAFRKGAEAV